MTTEPTDCPHRRHHHEIDGRGGNTRVEVKFGVNALRTVQMGLVQLARVVAEQPDYKGYLVLVDTTIRAERLRHEMQSVGTIFRADVRDRLTICVRQGDRYSGFPRNPSPDIQRILEEHVADERSRSGSRLVRIDYSFVVLKLLVHQFFMGGEPVTTDWIVRHAGCSYPTVAKVLGRLGSLLRRTSDRRVALRWFPREEFARLRAVSDRARETTRFVDRSGQPRSSEDYVRRLEKLALPDMAIGGVLGARHYYPDLDLVGSPRLDLSLHCLGKQVDLAFIEKLDPALRKQDDPLQPANVVVHTVRHADPLFQARTGGLHWADPVECLLDLHDARLASQAEDFLRALQKEQAGKAP